jgi:hypothetical protein
MTNKEKMIGMLGVALGLQEMSDELKKYISNEETDKFNKGFSMLTPILSGMPTEMKENIIEAMGKAIDKTISENGEDFTNDALQKNFSSVVIDAMTRKK